MFTPQITKTNSYDTTDCIWDWNLRPAVENIRKLW